MLSAAMSPVVFGFLGISGIGPMEMVVVGVIAVLLFGKRLPEVARSMGKSITSFKEGMRGVESEFRQATAEPYRPSPQVSYANTADDHEEATAPKFEPPAAEPHAASTGSTPTA